MENHQLIRPKGYERKGSAVAICKLNFIRTILINHYDRADLTAAQKHRLTALEVLRSHVLHQCDHVMHFAFADHV